MLAYAPNTLGFALFNVADMRGEDIDGNELQEGVSPEFYGTLGPNGVHRGLLCDHAGRSDGPDRDEEDEDDIEEVDDPREYEMIAEVGDARCIGGEPATNEDIQEYGTPFSAHLHRGARYTEDQLRRGNTTFNRRHPNFLTGVGNTVELLNRNRIAMNFSRRNHEVVKSARKASTAQYLASEKFRELCISHGTEDLQHIPPQQTAPASRTEAPRYKTDVTRRPEALKSKPRGTQKPRVEAQWLPPGVLAGEGLSKGIRR